MYEHRSFAPVAEKRGAGDPVRPDCPEGEQHLLLHSFTAPPPGLFLGSADDIVLMGRFPETLRAQAGEDDPQ